MMFVSRWILSAYIAAVLVSAPVHAQLISGIGIQQNNVDVAQESFDSPALALSLGWMLSPGVAVESSLNLPLTNDSNELVRLRLDNLITLGIKLQSPLSPSGNTAFFLAGAATATTDAESVIDQSTVRSSMTGYYAGLGFSHKIQKEFHIATHFIYHSVDQSVEIPSFFLGLQYEF